MYSVFYNFYNFLCCNFLDLMPKIASKPSEIADFSTSSPESSDKNGPQEVNRKRSSIVLDSHHVEMVSEHLIRPTGSSYIFRMINKKNPKKITCACEDCYSIQLKIYYENSKRLIKNPTIFNFG